MPRLLFLKNMVLYHHVAEQFLSLQKALNMYICQVKLCYEVGLTSIEIMILCHFNLQLSWISYLANHSTEQLDQVNLEFRSLLIYCKLGIHFSVNESWNNRQYVKIVLLHRIFTLLWRLLSILLEILIKHFLLKILTVCASKKNALMIQETQMFTSGLAFSFTTSGGKRFRSSTSGTALIICWFFDLGETAAELVAVEGFVLLLFTAKRSGYVY
jgi:hypothetical protein